LRHRLEALLAAHEQPETVLESQSIRRADSRRDELRAVVSRYYSLGQSKF